MIKHQIRKCPLFFLQGLAGLMIIFVCTGWGFFGHKRINRYAVFTLPPEMIGFYKTNIEQITECAVNPDRRRFAVVDEAPRHYIDLDHYGDSALTTLPHSWLKATEMFTEDTLKSYGILPWHINRMYYRLRDAFMVQDPERILSVSADIGHYIGDAHVPLHTTENYNGQKTGQEGIHGFWESRLVELYSDEYDFFVDKAIYIEDPEEMAWTIVSRSHLAMDSVLKEEKKLSEKFGERKYSFETKGKQTLKVYSQEYSSAYHKILDGMVERQMRSAVKMVASFWYTAWIDAGQPDLGKLIDYSPTAEDITARRLEIEKWKTKSIPVRPHEAGQDNGD
jgi:hypothetical protein